MSDPSPTTLFFFFNDTATTEIYTLSLHDALPISTELGYRSVIFNLVFADNEAARRLWRKLGFCELAVLPGAVLKNDRTYQEDRKSTRLNSSHGYISYAVFCLKKKKVYIIDREHS